MDKQAKKLRRLIEKRMPYSFHNIVIKLSFLIFILMVLTVLGMNFIKMEPIPFDENNTFSYTYIDVNQVQLLVDDFYVADDGIYTYLYYSEEPNIAVSTNKIVGVPMLIDEEKLKDLIPAFQRLYPDLKVNNVDDLIKYTGNYYFNHSAPPLLYDMQIVIVFSAIPLICWLIAFIIKTYYRKRYFYSLQNIISNKRVSRFIDEFKVPRIAFDSINSAVLFDYLVINHPSPFIIDVDDIVWAYIEKKKFFFLFDQDLTLVLYDRNLKKTRVLIASAFSSKNKKEMNQFLKFISKVNSSALIGYNQKNIEIIQQLKKGKNV